MPCGGVRGPRASSGVRPYGLLCHHAPAFQCTVSGKEKFPQVRKLDFCDVPRLPSTSSLRLRAIAANIAELRRSLDKPALAELPFFLGCLWVSQAIDFPARQF
jgi:hypothetical protein